ncbi:MAG: toast rack family protein [Candidatus Promineifilaceae bacterium]|nr:toast rack family protein [Candidatus Promineifilaceae bacterium]
MKNRIIFLSLMATALLVASGCRFGTLDTGPTETEERSIELGGAESINAVITIGAGELRLNGGEQNLLDATFTYNVADWQPEVSYAVNNGSGDLEIRQPDTEIQDSIPADFNDVVYEWDLRLGGDAPIDLRVNMGAGEGDLDLRGAPVEQLRFQGGAGQVSIAASPAMMHDLDVRLGAGEVELDLSGDWAQDLRGDIQGGVGQLTVLLPAAAGVRVDVQGGLGSINASGLNQEGNTFTNDAYGDAAVSLELDIQGGVGEIVLRVVE